MCSLNKVVVILGRLVSMSEAYAGKTNADIEKGILTEMPAIPYVARIEKVTVLDVEG